MGCLSRPLCHVYEMSDSTSIAKTSEHLAVTFFCVHNVCLQMSMLSNKYVTYFD